MVSVIIPTYNREKTIQSSIESVLSQTYKDIEVIIVDDCSVDNTEDIVKGISDKRVIYIKQEKNGGACAARNKGISVAKGEYIAFQDSDDIWKENKLEIQLENMKKNNSDLDFCMANIIDGKSNIRTIPTKEDLIRIKKKDFIYALCKNNFMSTQNLLLKKECLKDIKFDESLPRLQDYDLMLNLISRCKVSFTQYKLVNIYVQDDSISKSNEKLINACNIILNKKYNLGKNQNILNSNLLTILGDVYRGKNNKESYIYYEKALKNSFNLKVFIKKIISFIKI